MSETRHRSDHAGGGQERPRVDRRRDGARDHAQRVLAGRARHDGLLDRALRPQRPRRRAGPDPRRAARHVPDRDGLRARGARADGPAGGRLHRERSVRLRRPASAGHLRDQAGVRRRRARGLRGDDGPSLRRRRHRARQHRRARDRDLPGGPPDPALEARRRRRREHDAAAPDRGQHAPAGARARRPAGPARGLPGRRARADGA